MGVCPVSRHCGEVELFVLTLNFGCPVRCVHWVCSILWGFCGFRCVLGSILSVCLSTGVTGKFIPLATMSDTAREAFP